MKSMGMNRSVSRPHPPAFDAGTDTPHIGERAATRGRNGRWSMSAAV
jgi:hypothetical protein